MIILGIDPSLRSTGFGVVEVRGNQMSALCHGHIQNLPSVLPSRCLVRIGDA
jgi:Holliday junction resolvasome RuvABC endonuclease subunit